MIDFSDTHNDRTFLLQGEIVATVLIELEDTLNSFIQEDDRNAIIDLADVSKIDSMFLATLIRVKKKLVQRERTLTLINPIEGIMRVLELAGLDAFLMD